MSMDQSLSIEEKPLNLQLRKSVTTQENLQSLVNYSSHTMKVKIVSEMHSAKIMAQQVEFLMYSLLEKEVLMQEDLLEKF